MSHSLSRRRAITLLAAGAGLATCLMGRDSGARVVRWEGVTLGAPSSIQLYTRDEAKARAAIAAGIEELARLEEIFSVYRADSAVSALNRTGRLDDAPAALLELVTHALRLAEISGGAYDPTIQPLWQLYFQHFTTGSADPAGPAASEIETARALVDWRAVKVDAPARSIRFRHPGMGLTLNSGAQGYITDRVAAILADHGFTHMLVDMGEPRALSTRPDGSPWRIGIANPADPARTVTMLDVVGQCVSTSGGYGTVFDAEGRFTHLIDPRTGGTAPRLLGVSVVAETATIADGLSTAMLLVAPEVRQRVLRQAGGQMALYVTPDGVVERVTA